MFVPALDKKKAPCYHVGKSTQPREQEGQR